MRACLFSLSLLICLDLLFMFVMYLETQNLRQPITRPDFKTLLRVYKNTQLVYADVQNHILILENGYEKINTKAGDFDFGERRINWAYHPLSPALGALINQILRSPFWSLCLLNQIVLFLIFLGFDYWSRENFPNRDRRLIAWLILLFFIIPPLGYFVNFVIIPAFLTCVVFVTFRKWMRDPQENHKAFWILVISCFLLGFSRFQGLLVNASCLFLLIVLIAWHRVPLGARRTAIFALANILPFVMTLGLFEYYTNDPMAWAKIQEAWGVALVPPWWPVIRYWKSGLVFGLQGDDMFFAYFRTFVLLILAFLAAKHIVSRRDALKKIVSRRLSDSFVNLYFLTVGFGIVMLQYFTDLMVGNHRMMTLAAIIVLIWLEQVRGKIYPFVILILLFVRAAEFTLFFQGVLAFIW